MLNFTALGEHYRRLQQRRADIDGSRYPCAISDGASSRSPISSPQAIRPMAASTSPDHHLDSHRRLRLNHGTTHGVFHHFDRYRTNDDCERHPVLCRRRRTGDARCRHRDSDSLGSLSGATVTIGGLTGDTLNVNGNTNGTSGRQLRIHGWDADPDRHRDNGAVPGRCSTPSPTAPATTIRPPAVASPPDHPLAGHRHRVVDITFATSTVEHPTRGADGDHWRDGSQQFDGGGAAAGALDNTLTVTDATAAATSSAPGADRHSHPGRSAELHRAGRHLTSTYAMAC